MDLKETVKEAVEILKNTKAATNEDVSLDLGYNKTYISDLIGDNARKPINDKFLRIFLNYFVMEITDLVKDNEPTIDNKINFDIKISRIIRDLSSGLPERRLMDIDTISEEISRPYKAKKYNDNLAEFVVSETDYKYDKRGDNDIDFYNDFGDSRAAAIFKIPYFKNCIAVIIDSDCMEPLIKSGSVLLEQKIRDWKEHLEFGRVYDIMTTDKRRYTRYIKKIDDSFVIDRKEAFLLKCENDRYEDFELLIENIKEVRLIRGWIHKSS